MNENKLITACPDIEILEQCLENPSLTLERSEVLDHIAGCPQCKTTLEWLAGEPTWWERSRAALTSTLYEDYRHSPTLHIAGSICPLSDGQSSHQHAPQPLVEHELETLRRLMEPATHPELLGRLGRYELEELIGRGGMGLVFRAFDTELHRVVAIKTLAIHLVPIDSARERFVRESRACASLLHPHIVPIYDVLHDTPVPALVMQYVPGPSLEQWLVKHGTMEWRQTLSLLHQLSDALIAAHAEGLVHRDIKPGNVLVEADATRALLADFGLVRTLDDASLTHSGMLAGTPDFMSPEQARGELATEASDLFSLGSLAFTMLSGRPPFQAPEPFAVINRVVNEPHEFPDDLQATVPTKLLSVVHRLLEKNPADRFSSADELRAELSTLRRLDHQGELTVYAVLRSRRSTAAAEGFSAREPVGATARLQIVFAILCIGSLLFLSWRLFPDWSSSEGSARAAASTSTSKPRLTAGASGEEESSSAELSDGKPAISTLSEFVNEGGLANAELAELVEFEESCEKMDVRLLRLKERINRWSGNDSSRDTETELQVQSAWALREFESKLERVRESIQNLTGDD